MKKYYAKQFQTSTEVNVHVFKSMDERDSWVKANYDVLGANDA